MLALKHQSFVPTRVRLQATLAFVVVAFAANSLITRHVVEHDLLDPALLSAIRFLAGALALLALRPPIVVEKRHVWAALALGAYAFLISYGYRFIPAAAGTFVFYAAVFITLVASERRMPSARRALGGALALAGIALLAFARIGEVTLLGVALLALTGVAWGVYTALGRGSADPLAFTSVNFVLLGAVLLLPTAAYAAAGAHASVSGVLWAVAMGAGTTAFAYVAWYWCLQRVDASQAGLFQLAVPVVTAVGAVVLLDEPLGWRLAVAGALVVAGLWVGRSGAVARARLS